MTRAAGASTVRARWQRRPDDRPRALMAAALKLLTRRGYRRVSIDDVAESAGVSKGTVYHYFANKNELLTRTLSERVSEKHAEVERLLAASGGSATDRLRLFLAHYWSISLTRRAGVWQRLVVGEIVTDAPDVFAAWARGYVQRWRVVERLVDEGQAAGEFRPDADAEVAARAIVSTLSHQALFHVHFGMRRFAPCDLDRLFDAAVEQWLHGLRAPARRASRR
jgi:AcrR family transcriptional regulator